MPLNLIDVHPLNDYLAGFSENPREQELLQIALGRALRTRESNMEELRELPEDAPSWLKERWPAGGPYCRFKPDAGLDNKVRHVADWITASIANNEDWLNRCDKDERPLLLVKLGSLEIATEKANQYGVDRRRELAKSLANYQSEEEVVATFEGGLKMVHLRTTDELKYESQQLGHCIGEGGYDKKLRKGRYEYFSLRDEHNKPHATLEVDTKINTLLQCKGEKKGIDELPAKQQYMPALQSFIKSRKFKLKEELQYHQLLIQDNEYYDVLNLPKNFHCSSDLELHSFPVIHLPEGLKVDGTLNLGKTPIKQLPDNLFVKKDLVLYMSKITKLPKGLFVGENLALGGTDIEELPDDLSVGKKVSLGGTKKLLQLPKKFMVHGDLDIRGSAITELPDNLHVKRDLCIYNTAIKKLPKGLFVGRNLIVNLKNSEILTFVDTIPPDAVIHGEIEGLVPKQNAISAIIEAGPQRRGGRKIE